MKLKTTTFAALVYASACTPVAATNKALLIGVGEYQETKYDLEGPPNDIRSLKSVLQQYWHFQPENIRTLTQYDATKANIITALEDLARNASAEDSLFIYFSGHGTSVHDGGLKLPLPHTSGALIPGDFPVNGTPQQQLEGLLVGKRDIRPILTRLDNTGAHVFVAFDSCYSGQSVRGIAANVRKALSARNMDLNLKALGNYDDEETVSFDSGMSTEAKAPYPYRNIFFLSAANAREKALDIGSLNLPEYPTWDDKPHGAFTDALLRALSGQVMEDGNRDGQLNYGELHKSVQNFMKTRGYPHDPQILPQLNEDSRLLRQRPVLGQEQKWPSSPAQPLSGLLTVYAPDADRELLSRLKQLPGVRIAGANADLNLYRQGADYRLVNIAGDLIGTLQSPDLRQLVGRVAQEAWKKHFKQKLERRAAFNLDLSLLESRNGNSAIEGEKIAFTLRGEREMFLLLFDVDSHGTLSLLYPYRANELAPLPARQLIHIPGTAPQDLIVIRAPFGTDHLIAIGFAEKPPFLQEFVGKSQLLLSSDLYGKLDDYLNKAEYGFSELDVLTVAASAAGR